ncbi:MAG: hypothetical protein R3178_09185, partial [Rhodothermales bacterium]|nr:hypothetical protein [Rhodothermales bacterium]
RFERLTAFDGRVTPIDVDRDGVDELARHLDTGPREPQRYLLLELDRSVIGQVNVEGVAQDWLPPVIDLSDSGWSLAVPFRVSDSLFVKLVGLAAANSPRRERVQCLTRRPEGAVDGSQDWAPTVRVVVVGDLASNEGLEMVVHVQTGYGIAPRGEFMYNMDTGRLMDSVLVGAMVGSITHDDFGSDGLYDIVSYGHASENGNRTGGYSDSLAHIIHWQIGDGLRINRARSYGGKWSQVAVFRGHFDSLEREDLVAVVETFRDPARPPSSIEVLSTGDLGILRRVPLSFAVRSSLALDADRDGRMELVLVRQPDEILLLDDGFEVSRAKKIGRDLANVYEAADLDGDGSPEFFAGEGDQSISYVLDGDLDVISQGLRRPYPVRTGMNRSPLVLDYDGSKTDLYELSRNQAYILYRYGSLGLLVFGILLGAGLLVFALSARGRYLRSRLVDEALLQRDSRALLLLRADGSVVWKNARAHQLISSSALVDGVPAAEFVRRLPSRLPEGGASRGLAAAVPYRHELRMSNDERWSCSVDRISDPAVPGRLFWLVQLADGRQNKISDEWKLLARRVAHDTKNPLTSILLNTRHMQKEV